MEHFLKDEQRYKQREVQLFEKMEDLLDDEKIRKRENQLESVGQDGEEENDSKMSQTFDERQKRARTVPRGSQSNQYELGPTSPGSINPSSHVNSR